jgi:S-DNA-T family DNA segregation ATPase FtsK/SpoIIIE
VARKKQREKEPRFRLPEVSIRPETVRSIYAIGAGVVALLFLLAPIQAGGPVGAALYHLLEGLFGIGYYLLPMALIALAIGLMRAFEGGLGASRIVGVMLLFLSGTGLLSLAANLGGSVGYLILRPFSALFGIALGGVMLGALAVAGLLLTLDAPLALPAWRSLFGKRTANADTPLKVSGVTEKGDGEEAETQEPEEAEAGEPERGLFGLKTSGIGYTPPTKKEDIPTISFAPTDTAYNPPPVTLLEHDKGKPAVGDIKANANIIKRTLMNFGIDVEMDEVSIGPTVTRYSLKPAEGVRLQKILGLQNNLELALAASPVRIEAPIPGKSLVGIEVPNLKKSTVGLATLLGEPAFVDDPRPLVFALGRDISGLAHFANIGKMPHLLIAGATGSGKSVAIHALITSLLYRNGPASLRFIMVDPKRVELTMYNLIPHLLTPVITDPKKTILALKWAGKEMERRYQILESHTVRDIGSYHENVVAPAKGGSASGGKSDVPPPDQMPYIVIVIDELADIMQTYPRELEAAVVRLAQMSRAVGIHLVLSTQRPSVNVITGLIKANIPARMALQVASQIDSRTILDGAGAEKLLGAGDMLYLSGDMSKPHRIQTAYISENEVKKVVDYIKKHNEENLDEITLSGNASETQNAIFSTSLEDDDVDDDLFEEAKSTVEHAGKASTSFLQRKLRIGYARAARLMDILEERGIIGAPDGARPRDVLTQGSPAASSGGDSGYAENSE